MQHVEPYKVFVDVEDLGITEAIELTTTEFSCATSLKLALGLCPERDLWGFDRAGNKLLVLDASPMVVIPGMKFFVKSALPLPGRK